MGGVLSCVQDHDDTSDRSPPPPQAPLSSYLLDYESASPAMRLWMEAFDRRQLPLPQSVISSAPQVVHEAAREEIAAPGHQSIYHKYLFGQWSGGLHGLDEVFEQCRQVCAARRESKAVLAAVADESGRPSRCDSVGDDDSSPDEVVKPVPYLTDSFTGYALTHLMQCLHLSNEAHVFFLVYKLMSSGHRLSLADTTPTKLKDVIGMQEWCVSRETWINGWLRNDCTSLSDARQFCRQLSSQFDALPLDSPTFRNFHRFLFRFIQKDTSVAQVAVHRDTCVALWRVVFQKRWALLDYFCSYIQRQYNRSFVTLDQWDSLADFALVVRYELNLLQYDSSASSWPSVLDDFVAFTVHHLQSNDLESRTSSVS